MLDGLGWESYLRGTIVFYIREMRREGAIITRPKQVPRQRNARADVRTTSMVGLW